MPVDVREPEQVAAFADRVLERFGRVDVVVNNAGGQFAATPERISASCSSRRGGAYITGTTVVVDGGADAWGLGMPRPRDG